MIHFKSEYLCMEVVYEMPKIDISFNYMLIGYVKCSNDHDSALLKSVVTHH